MKKYILFGLRKDEEAIAKRFVSEHPELCLELHTEMLTDETTNYITAEHDALILSQVAPLSDELYKHISSCGIKVLSTRSAGYDMYNTELLKQLGIRLTNVPSYSPESIAEFAFSTGLYCLRKVGEFRSAASQGDFRWNPSLMTMRIADFVVGILGTGRIGQQTARLFKAMNCKILAYDLYPNESLVQEGILEYCSLEDVLAKSDLISLHMPATQENYHLLNKDSFAKIKPGLVLINTARGALIDTASALDALETGAIAALALDTYEFEASFIGKNNPQAIEKDPLLKRLLEHPRVLYTPHIAFYTEEAVSALFTGAISAAQDLLETGKSSYEVVL